jgi:monofunctional biosynthetic peptidoglycan transglycosylase
MLYNLERGRFVYGGSTISQQTTKNLFLSPSRNPLRKWHELVLTLALEHHLDKRRIMEHYLNVAQFGRGLFGVEAAARHYWGIPAARLSQRQAIELAATLPAPVSSNPATRNRSFRQRFNKINRHFQRWAAF